MNVPVLIVGQTGSGKSSSARNLPADKTVILNCERKPMPFKQFGKFKNINIGKHKDFTKVIEELKKNNEYEYVVIDSLTALLRLMDRYCNSIYSGYTVWREYNDLVFNLVESLKDLPQQVFLTAVPEQIEVQPGTYKTAAKTRGSEFKGVIEAEFSIVLHTTLRDDEEGNITEYLFDTQSSRYTTAKSPNGMFEERYIPNDMLIVSESINAYYDGEA